jgi:hypothetical protein
MPRTTIEFSDDATGELTRLSEALSTSSKAEVLRNALSLFSYIIGQLRGNTGKALAIVDESTNKIEKIIVVPGLQSFQSMSSARATRGSGGTI